MGTEPMSTEPGVAPDYSQPSTHPQQGMTQTPSTTKK